MWDWDPPAAVTSATKEKEKSGGVVSATMPGEAANDEVRGAERASSRVVAAKKRGSAEPTSRQRARDEDNESLEPKLGEDVPPGSGANLDLDGGLNTRPTTAGIDAEDTNASAAMLVVPDI